MSLNLLPRLLQTSTAHPSERMASGMAASIPTAIPEASDLADILFEQLDYLIQFADQEGTRLKRVMAILMEPFA